MHNGKIIVKGAREHNLKNIDIELPRNKLIIFTGVSGSGKSSLAFDTLYVEGQRRYIESMSAYARQFLGELERPDVDSIEGLSPTISIDQRSVNRNPRSTIGTVTEVYDYLRVLFAAIGKPHCPQCGTPISSQTSDEIVESILQLPVRTRIQIFAPIIRGRRGEHKAELENALKSGFARARIDGEIFDLMSEIRLERNQRHDIEIVVDRIIIKEGIRSRVAESVETALELGEGSLIVNLLPKPESQKARKSDTQHAARNTQQLGTRRRKDLPQSTRSKSKTPRQERDIIYNTSFACPKCNISFQPLSPTDFSFNSPYGMCPSCNGLGVKEEIVPELVVSDPSKSIKDGAIVFWDELERRSAKHIAEGLAKHYGFNLDTSWEDLSEQQQQAILYGSGEQKIEFVYESGTGRRWRYRKAYEGVIPYYEQRYFKSESRRQKQFLSNFMRSRVCQDCEGKRLKPEAIAVKIGGESIADIAEMPVDRCVDFFEKLELTDQEKFIAQELLKEIVQRLQFLRDVGLSYLTLNRSAPTLSNGEAQRIRLASQIGSGLRDVLYVLDEPSIGLHPRDHGRLLDTLKKLRDKGNTIVVVEHDEDTMWNADLLVDFGPGAGVRGGEIVSVGTPEQLCAHEDSITGQYLSGRRRIEIPEKRRALRGLRTPNGKWLKLIGARHHNLKNIDVKFPLGTFICITGVSGSGKSSLVDETLYRALARELTNSKASPGEHDEIQGIENIDKVIEVDQSPIGKTSRSCPATYIKVFDEIRKIFAQLPEAKVRGYKVGRFSFNVKAGRCEACGGMGTKKIEMHFLPDVEVKCEVCHGKRYSEETLQIKYRGKSIADVLEMDAQEVLEHFKNVPKIRRMAQILCDVGLDYIKLGQPSTTLSGGEAQRIKLARELVRPDTGNTLYIFDEPTTGLHFADIQKLLNVFQRLVDTGNTVLVVEHNPEIIKSADYIIDLGPEGGDNGGEIVATGTPEEIADVAQSATGTVLKKVLSAEERYQKARKSESRKARVKSEKVKSEKNNHLSLKRLTPLKRNTPPSSISNLSGNLGSFGNQGNLGNISVRGAREHNLKNIDVEIPHNKLVTFTGVSGSGKSSMALDTIYAEGQRRYVQTLSTYTRQFLRQLEKPHVDWIDGISPSIAIEQKPPSQNPRSTVGTLSEIYDYMRVLYARVGTPHCPNCGQKIGAQTRQQIVEQIMNLPDGTRIYVTSPIKLKDGEDYEDAFRRATRSGYVRVWVDGKVYRISEAPAIDKRIVHDATVVIDRLEIQSDVYERLAEAVENALNWSDGIVELRITNYELRINSTIDNPEVLATSATNRMTFSEHFACVQCGKSFEELIPQNFSFNNPLGRCKTCRGLGIFGNGKVCPDCKGVRIKAIARNVTLAGKTIMEVADMSIEYALEFFEQLNFSGQQTKIAEELLREICSRLQFLIDVGLHYLTLSRSAPSLARGEFQRINFASQLGSNLSGVLYVLDEPSVSLHQRDHQRLLSALKRLKDRGNSVIIIEHDKDTMLSSDELLDFGPGAGENGGRIVVQGTPGELIKSKTSLTGRYLNGDLTIDVPKVRRKGNGRSIKVIGAKQNNLKNIDVKIPLGTFSCVTGVSGAGKSSLIEDILYKALNRSLGTSDVAPGKHEKIEGIEQIKKVINVDQSPVGKTPRSNPGTYTKVFDEIRTFFAKLSESKIRGFDKTRFSFNRKGGRCEACKGYGYKKVEMQFLDDVWIKCDVCGGARYNSETLAVKYKGENIAEVLDMTVNEAFDHFYNVPKIRRQLKTLCDVGLDYVKLGQPSPTLSGGESQRLRLARELSKSTIDETLYIMDEPTTGLHAADIQKLLKAINRLVSQGNTVIVIEHNMELIKCADYIIDMGPEGGDQGGRIVGVGTPEQMTQINPSYTGKFLKEYLQPLIRVSFKRR